MPVAPFTSLSFFWLSGASLFAGVLNAIAGGGSFLSLPALLASSSAIGVGAVTAQATNTVALWPGQLTSLVAFRGHLRDYRRELVPLAIAAGIGGWIGGLLLLKTGNRMFRELLPWLLLFAAVMFVLSFPLGKWLQSLSGGQRYNNMAPHRHGGGQRLRRLLRRRRAAFSSWRCSASAASTTFTR